MRSIFLIVVLCARLFAQPSPTDAVVSANGTITATAGAGALQLVCTGAMTVVQATNSMHMNCKQGGVPVYAGDLLLSPQPTSADVYNSLGDSIFWQMVRGARSMWLVVANGKVLQGFFTPLPLPPVVPPAAAAVINHKPMAGTLVNGKCSEAPWLDMKWTPCTKPTPVDSFYKGRTVTGICAQAPQLNCVI